MLLAPVLGSPPRVIAERLGEAVRAELGTGVSEIEVAGPGFLNLVLADDWFRGALRDVLAAGDRFAAGGADPAERVLVEFVSANPTGPLVAASGRHAAYGDALARILSYHGHTVSREYYFNDAGNQIRLLGASVRARARGDQVPEGGYQGDYVVELAASIPGAAERDVDEVAHDAVEVLLAIDQGHTRALRRRIRQVLQRAHAACRVAERRRPGAVAVAGGRPPVSLGRRRVVADDRFRRRQGPRRPALQRRADVPGGGRRVHPEQARAGF